MSSEDHWRFGEDLESVHPDRDEVLIYVRVIPTEDNQRDAAVLRGAWDAILAGDDVTGGRRFGWRTFIMRAAGTPDLGLLSEQLRPFLSERIAAAVTDVRGDFRGAPERLEDVLIDETTDLAGVIYVPRR